MAIPCQIPVEISRDASFKDLRSLLGRWTGVPAENVGVDECQP